MTYHTTIEQVEYTKNNIRRVTYTKLVDDSWIELMHSLIDIRRDPLYADGKINRIIIQPFFPGTTFAEKETNNV